MRWSSFSALSRTERRSICSVLPGEGRELNEARSAMHNGEVRKSDVKGPSLDGEAITRMRR